MAAAGAGERKADIGLRVGVGQPARGLGDQKRRQIFCARRFPTEPSGDDATLQQRGCRLGGIADGAGQQVAAVGQAKLYRILFTAHP